MAQNCAIETTGIPAVVSLGRGALNLPADRQGFAAWTAPIVSLSTVPTLLLIALLKYFHHRPKPEQDEPQTALPISVEAAKEIIKATTDAMKGSNS